MHRSTYFWSIKRREGWRTTYPGGDRSMEQELGKAARRIMRRLNLHIEQTLQQRANLALIHDVNLYPWHVLEEALQRFIANGRVMKQVDADRGGGVMTDQKKPSLAWTWSLPPRERITPGHILDKIVSAQSRVMVSTTAFTLEQVSDTFGNNRRSAQSMSSGWLGRSQSSPAIVDPRSASGVSDGTAVRAAPAPAAPAHRG